MAEPEVLKGTPPPPSEPHRGLLKDLRDSGAEKVNLNDNVLDRAEDEKYIESLTLADKKKLSTEIEALRVKDESEKKLRADIYPELLALQGKLKTSDYMGAAALATEDLGKFAHRKYGELTHIGEKIGEYGYGEYESFNNAKTWSDKALVVTKNVGVFVALPIALYYVGSWLSKLYDSIAGDSWIASAIKWTGILTGISAALKFFGSKPLPDSPASKTADVPAKPAEAASPSDAPEKPKPTITFDKVEPGKSLHDYLNQPIQLANGTVVKFIKKDSGVVLDSTKGQYGLKQFDVNNQEVKEAGFLDLSAQLAVAEKAITIGRNKGALTLIYQGKEKATLTDTNLSSLANGGEVETVGGDNKKTGTIKAVAV